MKKYIVSFDQGTTSARAVIYGKGGELVAMCSKPIRQIYPQGGWVEHDPEDIWSAQTECAVNVLAKAGVSADEIAAIGIANQRETAVVWDKATGKPVYNAIVWQCRRTAGMCDTIKEEALEDYIYDRTGLKADPYFSATKLRWILDNVPGVRRRAERGEVLFGTVDSFLLWRLTGRHCTDVTNASRTMLFDIHTKRWSEDLLKLFAIPRAILPQVLPSGGEFGTTKLLGAPIPVCGAAGDQQAALLGLMCTNYGDSKCTYGTGCFMLMNTGGRNIISKRGLVTTLTASFDMNPDYALEGSMFSAGTVIGWLKEGMGIIDDPSDCADIARKVKDSGGVYFVPAFNGLGAPHWNSRARGTITGVTHTTTREHIVRAAEECVAYQVLDVLRAVQADTGVKIKKLLADGGLSKDDFIMQFQADIAAITVERPAVRESTSLGAAFLAGIACGMWSDLEECRKIKQVDRLFLPGMDKSARSKLILGWEHAIKACMA